MTQTNDRINRLEEQMERLAESQLQMSNRISEFTFQAQRLFTKLGEKTENHDGRIERLEAIAIQLNNNLEEQRSLNAEFRTTTSATLERCDTAGRQGHRILDYLLRNQGSSEQ
ncbi:MAG: hypothetical protein HC903_11095 [Methylacidiphilales bacterium]|nr:hypothetical protein [Candidatus Methylacidiphilales bacterium]NJR17133.1 hypothetical protein [Calothrix sp. CSU_2_0]